MVEKIQQQQLDQKEVVNKNRSINKIINSITTTEGEGFIVNRSFPTNSISYIDPFLLLDEMGPMDFKPGEAKGAPDHPHRGFETVTYLIEGIFEHKDSSGNSGKLNAGDIQWMTAGSGVIHSEIPEVEFRKKGGRLHGFQLWVNLPQKDKMTNPDYQDISSSAVPVVKLLEDNGHVKVIAGEVFDVKSTIRTKIPIQYLHFTLSSGSEIIHQLQSNYSLFCNGNIRGAGRNDEYRAFTADRPVAADHNRTSGLMEFRSGLDFLHAVVLVDAGTRYEYVVLPGPHCLNDLRHVVRSFSCSKNHLRKALAQRAVVIDVRKTQIFEGEISESLDGLILRQAAALQISENLT